MSDLRHTSSFCHRAIARITVPLFGLISLSLGSASHASPYGELYIVEKRPAGKSFELGASYITNLSNTFVSSHGLRLSSHLYLNHFVGLGATAVIPSSKGTSVSKDLLDLETADIHSEIVATDYAAFGTVSLLPFVGRWNFLNLAQLTSKISLEVGAGVLATYTLRTKQSHNYLSYTWSVSHSVEVFKPIYFVSGISGDRFDRHLHLGLQIEIPMNQSAPSLSKL